MKKVKRVVYTLLLSSLLVSNIFATGFSSYNVTGLLGYAIEQAISLLEGGSCPLRQCTTCRPTERDDNGNCRPR